MKYEICYSDYVKDVSYKVQVEASNVFDAIDEVAKKVERLEDMEILYANPVFE